MSRLLVLFASLSLLTLVAHATELADEDDIPVPAVAEPQPAPPTDVQVDVPDNGREAFSLLGADVQAGEFLTLYWKPVQSFQSIDTPVPVLIAHGKQPGPKLCLTAAIHGDELNGIEMVRRLMYQLDPASMRGTVIGIPIVNLDGFRRASRYLADRRDLNRHFPGSPNGSAADRIGHSLFNDVIRKCQFLVDLHTGSQQRINLPQIRGNLKDEKVFDFSRHFGGITVLHQLDESAVDAGVKSLETLLQNLAIQDGKRFWSSPQPVFYQSDWVRADQGGILMSTVKLGDKVREGQVLGSVIDPVSNTGSAILAPFNGRILGMAVNQVVQTGFATHHIGVETAAEKVQEEAIEQDLSATELAPSGNCVANGSNTASTVADC
jgi:predicted deacylase